MSTMRGVYKRNKKTIEERIEEHYGMSFKDVIETVHWKQMVPIASIADVVGCNRGSVTNIMLKHGLRGRNHQEAANVKSRQSWYAMKREQKRKRIFCNE